MLDQFTDLLRAFRLEDDEMEARAAKLAGRPRCGVVDPRGIGAAAQADCRWQTNRLTVFNAIDDAGGFRKADWDRMTRAACDAWAKVCDIGWDWVDSADAANVTFIIAKIDRKGSTLADATMPCGWAGAASSKLRVRMDYLDPWAVYGEAYTMRVLVHELGHILGLHHSPDPNDTMYFAINGADGVTGEAAARAAKLYGKPVAPLPPAPQPDPSLPPLDVLVQGPIVARTLAGRAVTIRTS